MGWAGGLFCVYGSAGLVTFAGAVEDRPLVRVQGLATWGWLPLGVHQPGGDSDPGLPVIIPEVHGGPALLEVA